jgi:hypothetical protein
MAWAGESDGGGPSVATADTAALLCPCILIAATAPVATTIAMAAMAIGMPQDLRAGFESLCAEGEFGWEGDACRCSASGDILGCSTTEDPCDCDGKADPRRFLSAAGTATFRPQAMHIIIELGDDSSTVEILPHAGQVT